VPSISRLRCLTGLLVLACVPLARACAAGLLDDLSPGGSLALTSDYIYRGLSESDGQGAAQADLHLGTGDGTYLGVWSSTRDRHLYPYGDADLELYLGHRFDLNGAFGATLEARSHYVLGGPFQGQSDYQELSAALSWLDRWTLSVTALPNAVRYWYYARLGRGPAWDAETSGQWLLGRGVFLTGGAGYYYASGVAPAYRESATVVFPATSLGGYPYGNAGVAFEYRRWRLDVGYFLTGHNAQALAPYPSANQRIAGTVIWRF
jgi:uncharacterized protein (TIGR02001 family)